MRSAAELLEEIIELPEGERRVLLEQLFWKFGCPGSCAFLFWDDLDDEEVDRAYGELAGTGNS